jgi:hypothetical protein
MIRCGPSSLSATATPHSIIARAVFGFIETSQGRMLFNVPLSNIHPVNAHAPIHMAMQQTLFETNLMWGVMIPGWVNIMTERTAGPSMAYEARSQGINLSEPAWEV